MDIFLKIGYSCECKLLRNIILLGGWILKIFKIVCTGILISVFMTGCAEEAAPQKSKDVQIENSSEGGNEAKSWKDVSTPEGFNNDYGIEPTLNAWIAFHAEDFANTKDVNEYLPKVTRISLESNRYFRVQGEDIEKDFNTLRALASTINHFSYVISEQDEQSADAKESQKQLDLAIKYFTELLHDLNIAINHDEKGEPFGVSRQLDGNKVEELESFIY